MELSWLMKIRIAAACAAGVLLIGIAAWPMVAPADPFGVVTVPGGAGALILMGVGFLAGLAGYFLAWPFGREIGILAVPAGLGIWAVRSGSIGKWMQMIPAIDVREQFFASARWEPIFWLAVVGAGFVGVLVGEMLSGKKNKGQRNEKKAESKVNAVLTSGVAFAGSVLMAAFLVKVLAVGIKVPDSRLGWVMSEPAAGQIVFAVLVSFGLAGFLVKVFLNAGYIWPTIASGFVMVFSISSLTKGDTLGYIGGQWPGVFFASAAASILPIQMVAFGVIGAIAGYWMGVQYRYWREHEI